MNELEASLRVHVAIAVLKAKNEMSAHGCGDHDDLEFIVEVTLHNDDIDVWSLRAVPVDPARSDDPVPAGRRAFDAVLGLKRFVWRVKGTSIWLIEPEINNKNVDGT